MRTIYDLKPAFQRVLRPVGAAFSRAGVSPNAVTVAALLLSAMAGAALLFGAGSWPLLFLPLALFARMALNAIDGMMAREYNRRTPLGAVLNELGDAVSDVCLYGPLAWRAEFSATPVALVVLLAVLSEMAGVVAVQIGARRRYDGPMGKSDRAFVFGALALALGCGAPAGVWVDGVLIAMACLLVLTVVNRVRHALREVR